jgi:hypothetical protein
MRVGIDETIPGGVNNIVPIVRILYNITAGESGIKILPLR